jgi:exo-beta-1,3-glucanase (GH17 family)
MKKNTLYKNVFALLWILVVMVTSCSQRTQSKDPSPDTILGNPNYMAFSYGGYRHMTRDTIPTFTELMEDLKILDAMGVKIIRTYNTQQFPQAADLLKAISHLKKEDSDFRMYVMLGAWIDCEGAWTDQPNHEVGDLENNTAEIQAAVDLANAYPDIVKVIAVGNEAMINWATSYYVVPSVILKWVEHLQELKKSGNLPERIWITSSDNYESWGGNNKSYHTKELEQLIKTVDYLSIHTYPFHETHYIPEFWGVPDEESGLSPLEQADAAMLRAVDVAKAQYSQVKEYMISLGVEKPIHIGETGWATVDNHLFGDSGTKAADEYKQKRYYELMREWTKEENISCFYFEIFDEQWKDRDNPDGSENHFGLINLRGEAKYALWNLVDEGVFSGLSRGGYPISKTYEGDKATLLAEVNAPPLKAGMAMNRITTINYEAATGEPIDATTYIIVHETLNPSQQHNLSYPTAEIRLNPWEGTCSIEMNKEGIIKISPGTGDWWGCGLELQADDKGENLSEFDKGTLHFDIRGDADMYFSIGFQTGRFTRGDQTNNAVTFSPDGTYSLESEWKSYAISIPSINKGADFSDVTSLLFLRGVKNAKGKEIFLRNIYYKQ